MNNDQYTALTLAELFNQFESLERQGADTLTARCEILIEYDRRGERHPKAGTGAYRFYKEIATGKLSALAFLCFADDMKTVRRLMNVSVKAQEAYATGATPLHISSFDSTGKHIITTKSAVAASLAERHLALTETGDPMPAAKQKEILLERTKKAKRSGTMKMRFDSTTDELVVNQMRLKLTAIAAAIASAGWTITKKKR